MIDLNTDIKAITKQTNDVHFVMYQVASHAQRNPRRYPNIGLAHAQVCEEVANAHCAVPAYIFDYADNTHLTSESSKWMGAYYGLAYKRAVIDGETFKPFAVKRITCQANIIEATFHVPFGKMVFDTTMVTDPGIMVFA